MLRPPEMFLRQLKFAEFDLSEMSLSSLIIATSHGPTEWVALPVFTVRRFFHTEILVRAGAGIELPPDLRGKRIGVAEYQQTAALWSRGILKDEFGVDPRDIEWFMERTPEQSHGGATAFSPPAGVKLHYIPPESNIGDMIVAGELDATLVYIARGTAIDRSNVELKNRSDVRPLFPDARSEARRYYAKTGIYPINHTVVVRRSLLERHPHIAQSLYAAFVEAKARAVEERDEAPAPYGIKESRRVLETIARYSFDQGLTNRIVGLDEVFATSTLDS